jgi:hypothetical protein
MYSALAVMLVAISIPIRGVPSVIAEVDARLPRPRGVARAIHAEFLSDGRPYLSIDSTVPILNDERPVLLDYATLERFYEAGTPARRDLTTRVRERVFSAIVLPDSGEFAQDIDRGDEGFDERVARFWAGQDSPLAPLWRSAYEVRAVRKPFVILVPSRQ